MLPNNGQAAYFNFVVHFKDVATIQAINIPASFVGVGNYQLDTAGGRLKCFKVKQTKSCKLELLN